MILSILFMNQSKCNYLITAIRICDWITLDWQLTRDIFTVLFSPFFQPAENELVWMTEVTCTGRETRLDVCARSPWGGSCAIGDEAIIECGQCDLKKYTNSHKYMRFIAMPLVMSSPIVLSSLDFPHLDTNYVLLFCCLFSVSESEDCIIVGMFPYRTSVETICTTVILLLWQ